MNGIDHKSCFKCYFSGDTPETRCPRCGGRLRSSTNLRVRGGILIFVGAFLVLLMGAITGFVVYLVWGGADPKAAAKLRAEEFKLLLAFGMFGLVMLFGLVSLITGVFQIVFGRRSRILVWAMMALVFILVIGAVLVTVALQ
ncbi:MAG: hypothetical protein ABI999_03145 [Acidobacteriota bacterium]